MTTSGYIIISDVTHALKTRGGSNVRHENSRGGGLRGSWSVIEEKKEGGSERKNHPRRQNLILSFPYLIVCPKKQRLLLLEIVLSSLPGELHVLI